MAGSTWHLGGLSSAWDIGIGSAVQVWPPCPIHLMYQQGLYARASKELILFSVAINHFYLLFGSFLNQKS